jgi:hypothetical protein
MTAPQPRPDGKPRLHVHKVAENRWAVDTGPNTPVLFADEAQPQALARAHRFARRWF